MKTVCFFRMNKISSQGAHASGMKIEVFHILLLLKRNNQSYFAASMKQIYKQVGILELM